MIIDRNLLARMLNEASKTHNGINCEQNFELMINFIKALPGPQPLNDDELAKYPTDTEKCIAKDIRSGDIRSNAREKEIIIHTIEWMIASMKEFEVWNNNDGLTIEYEIPEE